MSPPTSLPERIRPIFAAIRTVPIPPKPGEPQLPPPPPPVLPFITISRQPGAGAWTLAQQLVEPLNEVDPGDRPWTCWDRELVEKVAADYRLSERLIESLEDEKHSWLADVLDSLSFSDGPDAADEAKVYGRVAATMRALAASGRVVIVGRGGVFVTRRIPGGIHVRLVAPFDKRVQFTARQHGLSEKAAAALVRDMDRNRQAFYKRYWPAEPLGPETFTITLNTAEVDTPTMIQLIKSLVRHPVGVPAK